MSGHGWFRPHIARSRFVCFGLIANIDGSDAEVGFGRKQTFLPNVAGKLELRHYRSMMRLDDAAREVNDLALNDIPGAVVVREKIG